MTEQKNKIVNFSFTTMRELYQTGQLKDHLDCKNYIEKYFIPLTNGSHAHFDDGQLIMINDQSMKTVYLKRFEDDIQKWYKKYTIPKKLICDINLPPVGETYVNASKQLHRPIKEYELFNKKDKEGVNAILNFLKEVWANNDEINTIIY